MARSTEEIAHIEACRELAAFTTTVHHRVGASRWRSYLQWFDWYLRGPLRF